MNNKIPLDQNGVQSGYEVKHYHKNESLSNETPIAIIWRDITTNIVSITYYDEIILDIDKSTKYKDIAGFKLKSTNTPLSVRLAHHAASTIKLVHLINKPYA